MSTGTASVMTSQWQKLPYRDMAIADMWPRVAPLCLTWKSIVIRCPMTARPDGQCVTETVLTGSRGYQLTWETSLEIHQYLPQQFSNQHHRESKRWSSADPRFFANNFTVYDSASPVRCCVNCKANIRRRFLFTFLLGIFA